MNKLFEAKKGFPVIKKDAWNPFYKSNYASLGNILDAIEPVLEKHGFYVRSVVRDNCLITQICELETGNTNLESTFKLPELNDIQKIGSAITYARRYNLVAMLNLNIEDDDDGNATKPEPKKVEPPKTQTKPETITPECKTAMTLIEGAKDLAGLKIVYDNIKDSTKLTDTDKSFLNNIIKERKGKLK